MQVRMRMGVQLVSLVVAAMFAGQGLAQGAHVHGQADLRLVKEGSTLLLEFESPLDSLAGFEHAPATDAQREALIQAGRLLHDAASLFVLPEAAGCVLQEVQMEMPYSEQLADHDHDHDHGHGDGHGDGHRDVYAVYQFECATAAAATELRVGLFDAFSRIERIRVQTVSETGQGAVELNRDHAHISF
jgi:hypothetical protein